MRVYKKREMRLVDRDSLEVHTEQGEEGSMLPSVLGYTNIPKNPICDTELCPSACYTLSEASRSGCSNDCRAGGVCMVLTAVKLCWMQQTQKEEVT